MKNQISIGEMSKIHNIPIGTLRYYERIGIFLPVKVNEESGYRYYSPEQFEHLNTINYLKYLGVSLKTIKHHLEAGDEKILLQLLKEQQAINSQKIEKMNLIKNRFERRIKEIEEAFEVKEVGQVFMKRLATRRVLCIKNNITNRKDMELSLKELEKNTYKEASIFIGMVGMTINKDALGNCDFSEYNAIFILPEENIVNNSFVKIIEECEYVCIYHRETFY